ncbi:MAG: hypothetical protein ABH827_04260 [bacterium]
MFYLRLKKISLCAVLFLATVSATYCVNTNKPQLVTLEESFFNNYIHLNVTNQLNATNIQSLAHYNQPGLQDGCLNTAAIKLKIKTLGKEAICKTINKAFRKEKEFSKTHYVFYHGCSLDFLLFQDLLKLLTEIKTNKILTNFFLLRIPTPEAQAYNSVQQFLNTYTYTKVDDSIEPARSLLLSVNPSLFGNTVNRETSSAFCYFLASKTAFTINPLSLVSQVFDHYSYAHIYKKYTQDINDLYKTLTTYEYNKTGLLMQIFIPKTKVDQLIYRSMPRGVPYYTQPDRDIKKPSIELEAYQKNLFSSLFANSSYSSTELDNMQFRILLNQEMLNHGNRRPINAIKVFRHFNKTAKIKEYQTKLEQLKQKITQDLKAI